MNGYVQVVLDIDYSVWYCVVNIFEWILKCTVHLELKGLAQKLHGYLNYTEANARGYITVYNLLP